jgi:hypothetical protein
LPVRACSRQCSSSIGCARRMKFLRPATFRLTGIYMSFGKECYKLEDESEFTFAACLWISIHIFSTVGFGNVAPRQTCVKAQVRTTRTSTRP